MNEFGIIEKFFKKKQNSLSNELFHTDLMVGIGDDAAILKLSKNFPIAVSTDILVSGVHNVSRIHNIYYNELQY